jgi:hypothetical protein
VERLTEIDYLPQQHSRGVNIFPYKVAASAPFAAQIVIGAHQDALSTIFQQMQFLNKNKRIVLGIAEHDATEYFVKLYTLNSITHNASFFCAKHTFAGYMMPHTLFDGNEKTRLMSAPDYFMSEKEALFGIENEMDNDQTPPPNTGAHIFYESQIKSFDAWLQKYSAIDKDDECEDTVLNPEIQKRISEKYAERQYGGKYRVSATTLKEYYNCGLYWIYTSLLDIHPIPTDAAAMPQTVMGNIYHAILKEFFDSLILNNERVLQKPVHESVLNEAYSKILKRCIDTVFSRLPHLSGSAPLSPFAITFLEAQKNGVEQVMVSFLGAFLDLFSGSTIQASEKELIYDAFPDAIIKGYIDCILQTAENRTAIIDFKKNTLPKRESCISLELKDFQLLVYTLLAESNNYPEVSTALFMSMLKMDKQIIFGSVTSASTNKSLPVKKSVIERSGEQGVQIIDFALAHINKFINEIKAGNCTTVSTDFSKCAACQYYKLCRKTYDVAGKRNT